MRNYVTPKRQVILRLQNGMYKPVQVTPNTIISIPKYGNFSANLLLGRPYYVTYELQDITSDDGKKTTTLRPVPAAELHAETLGNDAFTPAESRDEKSADTPAGDESFDLVTDDGQVLVRNNRLTIDDPSRQALTMEEIEELKRADPGSGKEIIAKILASHSALSEKTSFSLAKYTLRKTKKYMRRFTVLPVDLGTITKLWTEKDPSRIMEIREEGLGLLMAWGNVHAHEEKDGERRGRYLVIDDASGLVTAAVAERMGILYPNDEDKDEDGHQNVPKAAEPTKDTSRDEEMPDAPAVDQTTTSDPQVVSSEPAKSTSKQGPYPSKRPQQSSATSNTITLLHANTQPNISLLEPFGYDADKPDSTHPLHTHLRTLTWLQLLDPASDSLYQEPAPPEPANEEEAKLPLHERIANMKSGKRSAYWRKRKRWERVKNVVDETREGGFDSIIIATTMDLASVLPHSVPLLRGGGNIAIYSPTAEPLTIVMDLYSRERRAAYTQYLQSQAELGVSFEQTEKKVDKEDFPVDPTLLLNPMLQTSRAREWQVLPMRTHPLMTGRGGAEGYILTATRVLPVRGVKIEAKGKFSKKKKTEAADDQNATNEMIKEAPTGNKKRKAETDSQGAEDEVKKAATEHEKNDETEFAAAAAKQGEENGEGKAAVEGTEAE